MIKYVLVDLDGTITNSEEGVTKSIQYALHHYGIEVEDCKQLRKYIGPPITWSFADAGIPTEKVDEAIEKYRERYNKYGIYEAYIYDGIPEMLKKLHEEGKKLILATSKPLHFAKIVMQHFGVDVLMDELCGADSDRNRNQKWEVIDYILKENNITDKSEVLMVGDTRFDVEGANICGIKTCGVLWGFGSRESLEKEGAAYIAETPEEVAKLICEL
ncbi:MAG: HAD hydrolase-like protein [Lachnospiraceae bacterium]|nr:HAD hydrolase-like protein [Lachnospiraceae bacterium]